MSKINIAEQDIIFKVPANNGKIYIREQNGNFQQFRRRLNFFLVGLFVLLPLFEFNQHQAVLFNLEQQTLQVFSTTLHIYDMWIFALIFTLAAFLLFYVTKLYGRVWCGYACPQTVWTLMFNWIERRVEGSHNQSRQLDQQKWGAKKVLKKSIKHILWIVLSLFTSLVFISYFVPARTLYHDFFTLNTSLFIQSWIAFFAISTYINAGWMREKMCQHVCPYSRFQSAMFNTATKLVTYDSARGETRGARKISTPKPHNMGDCVDCDLCVQVCPVGIDIRNGLQFECISCGLCIDACDTTMGKFKYKKGLIRYATETAARHPWASHLGYGSAVLLTIIFIFLWATERNTFEVSVSRDRQALYRLNAEGKIENTFIFKVLNKSQTTKSYDIQLEPTYDFALDGGKDATLSAGEHSTLIIVATSLTDNKFTTKPVRFSVTEKESGNVIVKNSTFYGEIDSPP